MLARPIDQGGIRNPHTHQPYALGTIQADVVAVRQEWLELRLRSATTWIEHELYTYEELELQAWRNNDLAEVRRVSAERRKLLGLDAPTKIASTTPDGSASSPLTSISIFEHVDHIGQE